MFWKRVKEEKRDKGGEIAARLVQWARKAEEEVLRELDTCREGLTLEEAEERLEKYGPNQVARERKLPWYIHLLKAYANYFNFILTFLAIINYLVDVRLAAPGEEDWSAVLIISTMIVVSTLIRFVQEYRSAVAAERLRAMVRTTAAIRRRGMGVKEVEIEEIVPGDIVHLAAGDMVPADLRILATKDLFVNQATLTGESEPVEKRPELDEEKKKAPSLTLGDLDNICFMGTSVVSGSAIGVVLATGQNTYFGAMAETIVGHRELTSFEKGVAETSKVFVYFMLSMVPVVFLINGLTKGNWLEAFLFAVAVAVGLTPKMLPMIVNAGLAKGAVAMAREKTIVKRLDAMQNFGAMTVFCSDKTGTLTLNKIVLEKHLDIHGNEDIRVLRHAFLNSYYQTGLRNVLDEAILRYGEEHGLKAEDLEKVYRKVDEIPFDFVRRRMSVVLESDNGPTGVKRQLVTKGAVEEVLSICKWVEYKLPLCPEGNPHPLAAREEARPLGELRVLPLTKELKREALDMVKSLNEDGLRVLAVAQKSENVPPPGVLTAEDEKDMVLMGFLAFLDPPKETALEAVRALQEHGVEIKILTGDNEIVAQRICKEVDLPLKGVVLGEDVDRMADEELEAAVEETTLFAKVTPMQKARIVRAFRRRGHVVGFLGDGINDAPAMREADVAISVDNAADIAKESADFILLEKSLAVLERGLVEGRRTFGNIMKYIAVTASSNFGNVFSVLVASSFLPFLPMMPLQLLFLNLTYDLSMTSMPWDSVDEEYIKKPRQWDAPNIGRFMIWFGPTSSIFDIICYALMFFVVGPAVIGGPYFLLPEELRASFVSLFQSGWFVLSLWTQTMVVYMLRTEKIPFIQSLPSFPVLTLTLAAIVFGTIVPYTPLGARLGMAPLPSIYFWIVLLPCQMSYLALAQYVKTIFIKRYGKLF